MVQENRIWKYWLGAIALVLLAQSLFAQIPFYKRNPYTTNFDTRFHTNILYVSATGNDATAIRGSDAFPYNTISNAVKNMLSGDTVYIQPGIYTVYPRINVSYAEPAVGITNRTNFAIIGAGRDSVFIQSATTGSVFVVWGCSNFTMADFTVSGVRVSAPTTYFSSGLFRTGGSNGFGLYRDLRLRNHNDHGFGALEPWVTDHHMTWDGCLFETLGGTNHSSLGVDGTAIGIIGDYMSVVNCTFRSCMRATESFGNGQAVSVVIQGNIVEDHIGGCFLAGSTNNVGWVIANNTCTGRGNTAWPTDSIWLYADDVRNSVVSGNRVSGFQTIILYDAGRAFSRNFTDNTIENNIFEFASVGGVSAGVPAGNTKSCVRNSYIGNKFRNIGGHAMNITGNGTKIAWNDFWDTGTNGTFAWAINCTYSDIGTNSTNITIVGNIIGDSGSTAYTDGGIRLRPNNYRPLIAGNRILAGTGISDTSTQGEGNDWVLVRSAVVTNMGIWHYPAGGAISWETAGNLVLRNSDADSPLNSLSFGSLVYIDPTPQLVRSSGGLRMKDALDDSWSQFEAGSFHSRTTSSFTNGFRAGLNGVALTNILSGSATLDFPSTTLGAVSDLPITVTGAASGDVVEVGVPQGSATGITGSYSGFASNNTVYVRFTSTLAGSDPASGVFKVLIFKF